ncbi:IS110 family transposase [Pedobacter miscanthi]|uniref:IS110 family transposase n=1 Tax=Pedobacter miscanthi TaxID=2259170 RepID=A0A366LDD6_9SPHI|nr:IS110 family transposase [Pedobacter miscanthi]RBQ11780.1 IS110 family transposase [Pedobacter miscanthi]
MKLKYFVGVDISKLTLDLTLLQGNTFVIHRCIKNESHAIKAFIKELMANKGLTFGNTVFGMESTGIYSAKLVTFLHQKKAKVVLENPLHLKNSFGLIRGKTDKDDSERIASYLYKSRNELRFFAARRDIIGHLSSLMTLRRKLIALRVSIVNTLKENAGFVKKGLILESNRLCSGSLRALVTDIKNINASIDATWKSDESLSRLMKILLSIPCIGPVIALHAIIATNEFRSITTAKRFASYCGVAPFRHRSGTTISKRAKVSQTANKRVKALLHTAAILSIRFVPDLRGYYKRKVEIEGKHKMLVINAIRFKIISRMFTCIAQDRFYQTHYQVK